MVLKNAAIVFSTHPKKMDSVIDQFTKNFDVEIIHIETSYSKLWITKKEEGLNDQS